MAISLARTLLCCPACRARLDGTDLRCSSCRVLYSETAEGIPVLLRPEEQERMREDLESDGENAVKNFFKRWPRVYDRMSLIISPILFTGLTGERFIRRFVSAERLLNVGSGHTRIHPQIVNVDAYPFSNVDVVANAECLPFLDSTFDVVCCDQVLEHVANPVRVVEEMVRVTKRGGLLYLGVPFIFPLHPSPKDYSRWSVDGICSLLAGCEIVESGVTMGPTSGMLTVLTAWLAIVCSFGIAPLRKILQYVFMILLNPLKLLDLVYARLPGASTIAGGVYVVAKHL